MPGLVFDLRPTFLPPISPYPVASEPTFPILPYLYIASGDPDELGVGPGRALSPGCKPFPIRHTVRAWNMPLRRRPVCTRTPQDQKHGKMRTDVRHSRMVNVLGSPLFLFQDLLAELDDFVKLFRLEVLLDVLELCFDARHGGSAGF